MGITILICAFALILAAMLVIWQAKALARCDLICKSCGTKQNLPWKRLVFGSLNVVAQVSRNSGTVELELKDKAEL